MNTLNRFSNLDDDYNESIDNNMNSFKPNKKSISFKTNTTVQDTNNSATTKEFNIVNELFPCLTKIVKKVKPVTVALSFSNLLTTEEEEEDSHTNVIEKEEEATNMSKECFVAVFHKKTRRLHLPPPPNPKTEEEIKVELFLDANTILLKLNSLHIKRTKEYLHNWGEDEYIRTFISERDVDAVLSLKN